MLSVMYKGRLALTGFAAAMFLLAASCSAGGPGGIGQQGNGPVIHVNTPAAGNTYSGTINVIIECADFDGTPLIKAYVDGGLVGTGGGAGADLMTPWDTTSVANGTHTLHVDAWDGLNNKSQLEFQFNTQN